MEFRQRAELAASFYHRVWDVRQSKAVRQIETGAVVTSIEVSQDGRQVTTADGQDVRIWDGATLEPVKSFKVVSPSPILFHRCID